MYDLYVEAQITAGKKFENPAVCKRIFKIQPWFYCNNKGFLCRLPPMTRLKKQSE